VFLKKMLRFFQKNKKTQHFYKKKEKSWIKKAFIY